MKSTKVGFLVAAALLAGCGADPTEGVVEETTSAITNADVMGFEAVAGWSTTTAGAVLGLSPTHTQGASSLAVTPSNSNGWTPLASVPVSTLTTVSSTLAVDVMLPAQQPNPSWLGAVQVYLTCPSRNIYNAYLAQVELTGKPLGAWNTLTFPLTSNEVASLLQSGYSDLSFSVVLNVAVPAGTYLFDNLRFLPQAGAGCSGMPNGTPCDDGNPCTQGDTCQAGVCKSGTPAAGACPASDLCHQPGVCDPNSGQCLVGPALPDWTACSDGDLCTRSKACQSGVCTGGQPVCDDGHLCTVDTCSPSTGACGHTLMTATACAAAIVSAGLSVPPLQGRVVFSPESDNNRCVPDAHHILNRLNATGELMGWHYTHVNGGSTGYANLDANHWHTETIIRMPYMAGTPLDGSLFVSAWSHPPNTQGAVMGVAKLQFKGGNQGKLLLTNRAFNDHFTGPEADWDVTPNPGDTFMLLGPQQTPGVILSDIVTDNHPGGGSALGTHVVMSLQEYARECGVFGLYGCTLPNSKPIVQVWDLEAPLDPKLRSSFLTHENGLPELSDGEIIVPGTSAVATAITKLNDGRFLLAVSKDVPVAQMEFYVSSGTNLDASDLFGTPGRPADAIVSASNGPFAGWQSFNFITDCNGTLWILGMRGDVGDNHDDVIENYQVTIREVSAQPSTQYLVHMTSATDIPTVTNHGGDLITSEYDAEGYKRMYCDDNHDTDQCDMASGAGTYVDPNGQVIVYATNYDNDGGIYRWGPWMVYGNGARDVPGNPNPVYDGNYRAYDGFIRGMEFHERHGNAAIGSACPTMDDAWVEFYSNPNYNSFGDDSGAIYRINYPSRDERNGKAFGTNDFGQKASSVRWCIPKGSSFKVFSGNWSDSHAVLNGTGQVAQIANFNQNANLKPWTYPYGGGNVNDSIKSGYFDVTDPLFGWTGSPDNSN